MYVRRTLALNHLDQPQLHPKRLAPSLPAELMMRQIDIRTYSSTYIHIYLSSNRSKKSRNYYMVHIYSTTYVQYECGGASSTWLRRHGWPRADASVTTTVTSFAGCSTNPRRCHAGRRSLEALGTTTSDNPARRRVLLWSCRAHWRLASDSSTSRGLEKCTGVGSPGLLRRLPPGIIRQYDSRPTLRAVVRTDDPRSAPQRARLMGRGRYRTVPVWVAQAEHTCVRPRSCYLPGWGLQQGPAPTTSSSEEVYRPETSFLKLHMYLYICHLVVSS